ncbi:hypothetical protein AAFC00_003090 [Neodothiora populina]|uniref:NAD(P)-binding domain-containing protein n=1 Tax=Neodothiora populina TaxID=2781224 RepID=A0ABR3PAM0_9PEZI
MSTTSPTTVLIFGGSGKVARHLTTKLTSSSSSSSGSHAAFKVHSIIRNPDQVSEIKALGAAPIVQDIESASEDDLVRVIEDVGADIVVWAAGAGGGNPERTGSVDRDGAIKSMNATAKTTCKRFIIVSALDVRDRARKPVPEWYDEKDKTMSGRVWGVIEPFLEAKLAADKDLVTNNARRGLEYTIIRPGGLTNSPETGKVQAGKVHITTMISRQDIAEVVRQCILLPETKGLAFDVVGSGSDDHGEGATEKCVEEVVREVAKGRVDCFEGFY